MSGAAGPQTFYNEHEHVAAVIETFRKREHEAVVPPLQAPDSRPIAIRWLHKHRRGDTFLRAVNYVDRVLASGRVAVHPDGAELFAASCLLIAAKMEEIDPPTLTDVARLCGKNREDLCEAERIVLAVLEYRLVLPAPFDFLRWYSWIADGCDSEIRAIAKGIVIDCSFHPAFSTRKPSEIAAMAAMLARKRMRRTAWTPIHVTISGYLQDQLLACAKLLDLPT
jgi:hypothetical protein